MAVAPLNRFHRSRGGNKAHVLIDECITLATAWQKHLVAFYFLLAR